MVNIYYMLLKKMVKCICFKEESRKLLYKKYKCNSTTFQDISWAEHNKSMESPTFNLYKQTLKLIYNRLLFWVPNYELNNKLPFCTNKEIKITTHPQQANFVQCNKMTPQHQERLKKRPRITSSNPHPSSH